ncbi:MAG TPA: cytochrome c oxidase subunit II [Casimicrobiaceae bacterium]|nr:cytochrome c oxidase subunit II [Casimicrobiaceae bacterium]
MKSRGATPIVAMLIVGNAAAQTPMSYVQTHGPTAHPATVLGWGLGGVSLAVMTIIAALLLGAIFRRRPRQDDVRALAVNRDAGGLAWIYVGVGITFVVLIGCMVWTMVALASVAHPRAAPKLTIEIEGNQWWWGARYGADDPAQIFWTANEIHVPVGEPVRFRLASGDVIHSFWVPQLAGKTDVIPGQTNVTWLEADRAGIYRGQCGEFCGAQHAGMALSVIAEDASKFAAWRAAQLQPAPAPTLQATREGLSVFVARCGACHTVRGTGAGGMIGPDLTHVMSRRTIAAGLLPNNSGNLAGWIANAQSLKPGCRMPNIPLSGPELGAVVAYLTTLH